MAPLPGVTTRFKDTFYSQSRTNVPAGPNIVLVGRRETEDGTAAPGQAPAFDLDPTRLQDAEAVKIAFGDGSDIHRGFIELLSAGSQRVTAVAIPRYVSLDEGDGELEIDGALVSEYGDTPLTLDVGETVLDRLMAAVEAAEPDIVVFYGRGGHPTEWEDPATPNNEPWFGLFADNDPSPSDSLFNKLAEYIRDINLNTTPCIGIIGVKPWTGGTRNPTASQVKTHLSLPDLIDRENVTGDGYNMVVVQAELRHTAYPTAWGFSNGATAFAGHLASLEAKSSPAAKSPFNVAELRYQGTNPTKEALLDRAVTPLGLNFRRAAVWADAMTFSKLGSDYSRITTRRIANDAANLVRQVANPFIGEIASNENKNALETAITGGLRAMQIDGALYAADFVVTYTAERNQAIIDLSLVPAFELRNIELSVSIKLT